MRNLDTGFDVALIAGTVHPRFFVEIEFESGPARYWSGLGDFVWDSKTWLGVGNLGAISPMGETADLRAEGVTLSLSGVDPGLLGSILGDVRQGLPATVYFGLLTDAGVLVAAPFPAFSGRVDVPTTREAEGSSVVTLSIESVLVDMQKPRLRRYTHEDQQLEHPGDLGFQFLGTALRGAQQGVWSSGFVRHGNFLGFH